MHISVTDPLGHAWHRMVQILFQPFAVEKWFVLGFAAWLAHLGEGAFQFNFQLPGPVPGPAPAPGVDPFDQLKQWLAQNLHWLLPLLIAVFVVIVAFWVLFTWIQCRGQFIFLEGICRDRAEIVRPWKQYRAVAVKS